MRRSYIVSSRPGQRQARVERAADALDALEQLRQPLERVVLALHGHDQPVRGRQRVDRQQAERRRAVEDHVRVGVADRRDGRADHGVAVLAAGQLERGRGQIGVRRRKIEPGDARRHDDVGQRDAVQQVVGRPRGRARAHAEPAGGVGLRVEVDHEHGRARLRETRGDVDRGRRLAHAALLVRDCIDARHRPDPTVAVGRIRARATGAWRPFRAAAESAPASARACRRRARPLALGGQHRARRARPPRRRAPRPRARATTAPAARPGAHSGRHSSAATGRRRQRSRDHAGAGVAQRAARDVLRALGVHVRRAPRARRPPRAMKAALRPVASIRWVSRCGPHDRQHEARAGRRRCRRPRAGPAGRHRRPAGPPAPPARGALRPRRGRGSPSRRRAWSRPARRAAQGGRALRPRARAPRAASTARAVAAAVSRETRGRALCHVKQPVAGLRSGSPRCAVARRRSAPGRGPRSPSRRRRGRRSTVWTMRRSALDIGSSACGAPLAQRARRRP